MAKLYHKGGTSMLRKLLLSSAAATAMVGSALAADLRAPPPYVPPPPVFTWTGFYIGVNAGGTFANNNNGNNFSATPGPCNPAFPGCTVVPNYSVTSATALNLLGAFNNNGNNSRGAFIGGGQIGFNYQISPSFVVGVEADFQGVAGNNNNNNNFICQDVAVCAGAGTDCSGALQGNGFNNGNSRVGYTLGGGIEWMFLPNWSVKAEALYYDLGRNNNNNNARLLAMTCNGATCAVPGGLFASSLITQNSNRSNGVIARAGINYHFNWGAPAPVVARY